jgi:hypothetical protein
MTIPKAGKLSLLLLLALGLHRRRLGLFQALVGITDDLKQGLRRRFLHVAERPLVRAHDYNGVLGSRACL